MLLEPKAPMNIYHRFHLTAPDTNQRVKRQLKRASNARQREMKTVRMNEMHEKKSRQPEHV
jgi:hypothetical protein